MKRTCRADANLTFYLNRPLMLPHYFMAVEQSQSIIGFTWFGREVRLKNMWHRFWSNPAAGIMDDDVHRFGRQTRRYR